MKDIKEIIGNNIKRLCDERGITGSQLAEDLGVSQTTQSAWVTGKSYPRSTMIDKMAKYFNVDKSVIMNEPVTVKDNSLINLDLLQNGYVSYKGKLLNDKQINKLNVILGILFEE